MLVTRRGPLSLGVNQAGGFVKSRPGLRNPNLQLFFSPVSYTEAPPGKRPLMNPDPFPGFLLEEVQDLLEAAKLIRLLAAASSLAAVIEAEIAPGPQVQSDEDLIADCRMRAGTVFHPVGSCRMGPDRSQDVVDARLRVHGVDGLRVADASIFPTITSGNTNAPAIMVGEKAASLILEDS